MAGETKQLILDKSLENDLRKIENKDFESLQKQVDAEYKLCYEYISSKITTWIKRLKLYNNQKRDQKAVGDPLLFTIFQTILASLYDDQLMVEFGGREEGDEETAENLNDMAEFDYTEMEKDIMDYMWIWDTLFFGRGLTMMYQFTRKKQGGKTIGMHPVPEVIDPLTFLRDPRAQSVNGDLNGFNAARFMGREIRLTKAEIKRTPNTFNVNKLKKDSRLEKDSLIDQGRQARAEAQGLQLTFNKDFDLKENTEYKVLEWMTHWQGKKVLTWWGNSRKKIVRYQVLGGERWPIIDRPLYPTSHDWDGTSIPDLTEDKQRARSVAINLGLEVAKADLYPMYIYDKNKIKNRGDLNFGFNKFIPVDVPAGGSVNNAVQPMNKVNPNIQMVNFILETLDVSAQRATATPEIQQGQVSEQQRTLGEIQLVSSKVDTRYSLSAKIFGWSEKRYWREWYYLYKKHMESDIDEKVLRLKGALGTKWRKLTRENIIAKVDPDVMIESRVVREDKRTKERLLFSQYLTLASQAPNVNILYGLRKLGRLNGMEKDEVERLLPPTVEEMLAEDENERLSADESVDVSPIDDHLMHLEINSRAADTKAKYAHLETHKRAIMLKRINPAIFPEAPIQEERSPINLPTGTAALLNVATRGQDQGELIRAPVQK